MKSIITKKEQEKKTQRNQIMIGIILIGLMLLSTAGYALSGGGDGSGGTSTTQKIDYNGISFVKNSEIWQFEKNGNVFTTRFNPQETQEIKVLSYLKLEDYNSKPLYFVGSNDEAIYELNRGLNDKVLRVQKACLSEKDCKDNFPVKDCNENIIIIQEPQNESENIYRTNNCVFIVANSTEQVKYSDALLFKILGI